MNPLGAEPVFVNVYGTRDGIFKLLRSPGIDSASLSSLAGRYDNRISTRFLAPIDCSKISALESIPRNRFLCSLCSLSKYLMTTSTFNNYPIFFLKPHHLLLCMMNFLLALHNVIL